VEQREIQEITIRATRRQPKKKKEIPRGSEEYSGKRVKVGEWNDPTFPRPFLNKKVSESPCLAFVLYLSAPNSINKNNGLLPQAITIY
jgi:hypothetical protein